MSTLEGLTSDHPVTRGVPQGGVLSPTLFTLALIGLTKVLPKTVSVSVYADDICIWTSGVTRLHVQARLQKAVSATLMYLRRQGLEISTSKSATLAFTRKPMMCYPVKIEGAVIPCVTHHKFLGVTIDRDLSWSKHVSALQRKLQSFTHVLQHMAGKSWGPSVSSLLRLYQTLFIGYLQYSAPMLCNLRRSSLRMLQSAQAQALRICLGLPRCTSTCGTTAEARACPIQVYLAQEPLRVHLRHVTRHECHPLASVFRDRPNSNYSRSISAQQHLMPFRFAVAKITEVPQDRKSVV